MTTTEILQQSVCALQTHICRTALQCMEIWGGSHAAEASVTTPGLDVWVYSRPYAGAKDGGDVHYVSLCGGGQITRLILADVAGHGAKVADLARSLRNLMRQNINSKSHARLVRGLNDQFSELNRQGRFATAVIATYLANSDKLTVCNAGHPPPLVYRAATASWMVLNESLSGAAINLPLGIDAEMDYEQQEFLLARGDLVLCYTDALTEATNAQGRQLGQEGLLSLVRNLDVRRPGEMAQALVENLESYRDARPLEDDLTFLLLHHNAGHPPRLSLGQKLDIYAKFFGLKSI